MTKQECAIVTAYTEFSMLRGDDLEYLYRYLSEIVGRPVFSHELPAVCVQFRDKIKADFIALCRNASDDIVRDDESTTARAKMPELIDRHALLKSIYGNPPEKARMTHAEWYRKCIYEAPTIEPEGGTISRERFAEIMGEDERP